MGLSIIIIHTAPENKYLDVLKKTIESIRRQAYQQEVEILVADDGSCWSQKFLEQGEDYRYFDAAAIAEIEDLDCLSIDGYFLARTSRRYLKAVLWNRAVAKARFDNLVFLDDDHPFSSKKALQRYAALLDQYEFVYGRLRNPNGTYRRFHDPSVQGTNFAMRRELFEKVEGFGLYTADWGCGEDSDLFWKVYKELIPEPGEHLKAFYAADILTEDLCSGRWGGCLGGADKCIAGFQELHGVDVHKNASRRKQDWVKPSMSNLWLDFHARVINYWVDNIRKS